MPFQQAWLRNSFMMLVGVSCGWFGEDMDLKAFLEQLFGCAVDLVLSDAIKPRLRPIILGEAVHAP